MSPTLLYSLLIISFGGILILIVSKMQFVERFLRRKKHLMESTLGKPSLRGNYKEEVDEKIPTAFDKKNFWDKGKGWVKEKLEYWRKNRRKKVEDRRVRQMKDMEADKLIEGDIGHGEVEELPRRDDADPTRARTVQVARVKKKSADIDREETKLINRIALHPQNKENYRSLGDFYLKYGKLEDAKECYRHVLKIDDNDEHAKDKLSQLRVNF